MYTTSFVNNIFLAKKVTGGLAISVTSYSNIRTDGEWDIFSKCHTPWGSRTKILERNSPSKLGINTFGLFSPTKLAKLCRKEYLCQIDGNRTNIATYFTYLQTCIV